MRMNGNMDIEGIRYFPIRNYQYEEFFQDVQYTGETLNAAERSEYVKMTDETIAHDWFLWRFHHIQHVCQ